MINFKVKNALAELKNTLKEEPHACSFFRLQNAVQNLVNALEEKMERLVFLILNSLCIVLYLGLLFLIANFLLNIINAHTI